MSNVIPIRPLASTSPPKVDHRRKSVRRSEYVGLRLTVDEALAFRLAAEAKGQTLADWLRSAARKALAVEASP